MKILRDIPLSLTPEYVLQEIFRRQQKPARSALLAAEEAVTMSRRLIVPAAVYDALPVRDVVGEQVILIADSPSRDERRLTLGPKADLLTLARQVMVTVYTIGPALETRVHELYQAGEDLLAFMLDSVGVAALGTVGEALHRRVEELASELGWGVSPALGPGSLVGWPLQGQRELCALLPLEKIGAHLNSHCVLQPHKSVSMVIGLGPGYESSHVGSVCCYCSLADSCWRRRGDTGSVVKTHQEVSEMADVLQKIASNLYSGEDEKVAGLVREALNQGMAPSEILQGGLVAGMDRVGMDFKCGELFVPEVLIAARAMHAGMKVLRPLLAESETPGAGKYVIGTVKGDLHDIGKNLVKMMLEGAGFETIDLGTDASPADFVAAVREHQPRLVGMSALLTTTMGQMKTTVEALEEAGLRDSVKIMVGGAPVTAVFAKEIGADAYAPDAATAVDVARGLAG